MTTTDPEFLWDIIPQSEKALCTRIATAVLEQLKDPTQAMLKAADRAVGDAIAELARIPTPPSRTDSLETR